MRREELDVLDGLSPECVEIVALLANILRRLPRTAPEVITINVLLLVVAEGLEGGPIGHRHRGERLPESMRKLMEFFRQELRRTHVVEEE